jgi:hypothetical protein
VVGGLLVTGAVISAALCACSTAGNQPQVVNTAYHAGTAYRQVGWTTGKGSPVARSDLDATSQPARFYQNKANAVYKLIVAFEQPWADGPSAGVPVDNPLIKSDTSALSKCASTNCYGNYVGQPVFATDLLSKLTQAGTLAFMYFIGRLVTIDAVGGGVVGADILLVPAARKLQVTAGSLLANALITATAGQGLVPHLSLQWAAKLLVGLQSGYSVPGASRAPGTVPTSDESRGGSMWELGTILDSPTSTAYSTALLNTFANGFLTWDNQHGRGGYPTTYLDLHAGTPAAFDPMVGLLQAVGTNPGFSYRFLTRDVPWSSTTVLKYLVNSHKWFAKGSDYATALGIDIAGAIASSAGPQAAGLLGSYLSSYAGDVTPTLEGKYYLWTSTPAGPYGAYLAGLRTATAAMFANNATYVEALAYDINDWDDSSLGAHTITNGQGAYVGYAFGNLALPCTGSIPNGSTGAPTGMSALLFQVGMSPQAERVLVNALVKGAKDHIGQLKTYKLYAYATGYLMAVGNDGSEYYSLAADLAAQNTAAQQSANSSLAADFASAVASFTGPGGEIVSTGISVISDVVHNHVNDVVFPNTSTAVITGAGAQITAYNALNGNLIIAHGKYWKGWSAAPIRPDDASAQNSVSYIFTNAESRGHNDEPFVPLT